MRRETILVTGASGFVGRALVDALRQEGQYRIRAMSRRGLEIDHRFGPGIDPVQADVLRPETLPAALEGVDAAYYLIHSLDAPDYDARDMRAAEGFSRACRAAGVQQIIYLGAMRGRAGGTRSPHLCSRDRTGDALRSTGVPVTELGASVVIGAGGLVFEMIRAMVERLPVVFASPPLRTRTLPIALSDVVRYLIAARRRPEAAGQRLDIAGDEVISYLEMMRLYARLRGLRRPVVPVPFSSARLSALSLHLLAGVPLTTAHALQEGQGDELLPEDDRARRLFGPPHATITDAFLEGMRTVVR